MGNSKTGNLLSRRFPGASSKHSEGVGGEKAPLTFVHARRFCWPGGSWSLLAKSIPYPFGRPFVDRMGRFFHTQRKISRHGGFAFTLGGRAAERVGKESHSWLRQCRPGPARDSYPRGRRRRPGFCRSSTGCCPRGSSRWGRVGWREARRYTTSPSMFSIHTVSSQGYW